MTTQLLEANYITSSWEEKTVTPEGAPIKIARCKTERKFTGAMSGAAVAEYVMCYHVESKCSEGRYAGMPTASYVGTMHFKGSIGGSPEGGVVFMTTNGSFTGSVQAEWTADEKTATGGLKGLQAKGGYKKHLVGAAFTDPTRVWLQYTL